MRFVSSFLVLCGGVQAFTYSHGRYTRVSTSGPLEYIADDDLPDALSSTSDAFQRRTPVRRSFLHQLDRFLTELQGTHDHLRKVTTTQTFSYIAGAFPPFAPATHLTDVVPSLFVPSVSIESMHSSRETLHLFRRRMLQSQWKW